MPVADDPSRGARGRVLLDAAGEPIGRYEAYVDAGVAYADMFERAPGVSVERAAAAILAELRGARIVADEPLGKALVAAGGKPDRRADLLSHPHPSGDLPPDPPGVRLTPVDRPAADLVDAYRAAHPPGHPDYHDEPPERRLEKLADIVEGRTAGPLLASSGLAVTPGGTVVAALLAGTFPGEPPLNGPWVLELFRHPDYRGTGRALLERALALAGRDRLPALGLAVTEGNPARRLYDALGFAPVQTTLVVEI